MPEPATPGSAADEPTTAEMRGKPDVVAGLLKERIYATITLLAVVVGEAEWPQATHSDAAAAIGVTAVGLWLASLVADEQSHRVIHGRIANRREAYRMLYVASPLLLSAVGPLLMIGFSALGALPLHTALYVAAGVDVLSLFVWGCTGGLRMGARRTTALLAGAMDTAIGLAVVALKLLID